MITGCHKLRRWPQQEGAVLAELAILLPVLVLLVVIGVDYSRVFYQSITITNCARNGAMYLSDPASPLRNRYATYQEAALADAGNMDPPLKESDVTSEPGSDAYGAHVTVTVTYKFPLVSSYLGFSDVTIKESVTMRLAPRTLE